MSFSVHADRRWRKAENLRQDALTCQRLGAAGSGSVCVIRVLCWLWVFEGRKGLLQYSSAGEASMRCSVVEDCQR
jgi:hypothetical protein